jgi:Ras family protein
VLSLFLEGAILKVCQSHFQDAYYPTIESTFAKSVTYKGVEYDCQIIDTAGQVKTKPTK